MKHPWITIKALLGKKPLNPYMPNELLFIIFSKMEYSAIAKVSCVCSSWNEWSKELLQKREKDDQARQKIAMHNFKQRTKAFKKEKKKLGQAMRCALDHTNLAALGQEYTVNSANIDPNIYLHSWMLARDEMHMFRCLIRSTKATPPEHVSNKRLFFVQVAGIYLHILGQSHIEQVLKYPISMETMDFSSFADLLEIFIAQAGDLPDSVKNLLKLVQESFALEYLNISCVLIVKWIVARKELRTNEGNEPLLSQCLRMAVRFFCNKVEVDGGIHLSSLLHL